MKTSQVAQNKQLKASYERVTHEVMQQLETARRNEVKILVSKYKDKDELERLVFFVVLLSGLFMKIEE